MSTIPSIKLSALTGQIQSAIDGVFGQQTYWVIADVSNYTYKAQSNYHYFELVEKEKASSKILAKIAGRAWGNASVHIANFERVTGQKFKNDINVLVQVSVQYSPAFGLQLNVLDIDTNFTLGLFEQQRKETLERLIRDNPGFIRRTADGYETRNSTLPLNRVLQKIAVISSDTSAGFQDFKHTLQHNPFGYHFEVDDYFTLVQGDNNAKPLLAKMIAVYESKKDYDVLVIIRGGGAQLDFLIFDNYELSRAVAKFPIPVITGIGHQKNETIVDLMAHTSTKTPTKAAELIIAHNRAFEENLLDMQKMILIKTYQLINYHKGGLVQLNQQLINTTKNLLHARHKAIVGVSGEILTNPRIILSNKKTELQYLKAGLESNSRKYFLNKSAHIAHFQSVMRIMSPQNILNKGFAILKVNGKITADGSDILPGNELTVRLASTEIKTIVKSKETYNGNEFNL